MDITSTSSFAKFVADNGILATSAGITIGFATATFVKSFIADVIMPLIFLAIFSLSKKTGGFVGTFLSSKELRFTNFVSELITWVFIILVAYIIIELIRRSLKNSTTSASSASSAPKNPFMPPVKENYAGYAAVVQEEMRSMRMPKPVNLVSNSASPMDNGNMMVTDGEPILSVPAPHDANEVHMPLIAPPSMYNSSMQM